MFVLFRQPRTTAKRDAQPDIRCNNNKKREMDLSTVVAFIYEAIFAACAWRLIASRRKTWVYSSLCSCSIEKSSGLPNGRVIECCHRSQWTCGKTRCGRLPSNRVECCIKDGLRSLMIAGRVSGMRECMCPAFIAKCQSQGSSSSSRFSDIHHDLLRNPGSVISCKLVRG